MARFGARPQENPPSSQLEVRVQDLAARHAGLEKRAAAIQAEAEELRNALDRLAEKGEDAGTIAADLVAVDGRARAVALELQAVGRAHATAEVDVAAVRENARRAGLEATLREREASFRTAEGRFRDALRVLSDAVGPAMQAHHALEEACYALKRPAVAFYPDRADDELAATLRAAGGDVEILQLALPWLVSRATAEAA